MTFNAGAVEATFTAEDKGFFSSISKIQKEMRGVSSGFSGIADEMQNFSKQAIKWGSGLALAVGGAVGGILKAGADTEKLTVSLKTAFQNNEEEAKKAYQIIFDFAKKTPYAMNDVVGAFLKLKNMGLDPGERALTSYGNTASSMGKSLNDMVEAVADATTGEFERLKEFGIRSSKEGDRVKFTFQGVTTEIGFNSNEIQNYLLQLGETKFSGGMEAQGKTLTGMISTLKDTFYQAMSKIAFDSGLMQLATEKVGQLTTWIEQNQGKIVEWVNIGINFGIEAIKKLVEWLTQAWNWYQNNKVQIDFLISGFLRLAPAILSIVGAIVAVGAVIGVFSVLTNPIGQITLAVYGLIKAFEIVKNGATETLKAIERVLDQMGVLKAKAEIKPGTGAVPSGANIIPNAPPKGSIFPKKASGSYNFGGGLTNLAEQGFEIVARPGIYDVPRGARIFNNEDSQKMLGGGVTIQNMNVASTTDWEMGANILSRKLRTI